MAVRVLAARMCTLCTPELCLFPSRGYELAGWGSSQDGFKSLISVVMLVNQGLKLGYVIGYDVKVKFACNSVYG